MLRENHDNKKINVCQLHNILQFTPRSSKWFFSSGCPTKTLYAALLSSMHVTFPTHRFLLFLITRIIFGEEQGSWRLSLLRPNIFLSTRFSNTRTPYPSLSVTEQASHSFRTAGRIIVLYNFVYMVVHGCMFGMLLLISVGYYFYAYVFVLLCYVCSVLLLWLTLTEVFPYFFLSCKANARV